MLMDGKDPLEVRKAALDAANLARARMITFNQCAAQYIAAHRESWKNACEWRRIGYQCGGVKGSQSVV
jgi:hypothetical protein